MSSVVVAFVCGILVSVMLVAIGLTVYVLVQKHQHPTPATVPTTVPTTAAATLPVTPPAQTAPTGHVTSVVVLPERAPQYLVTSRPGEFSRPVTFGQVGYLVIAADVSGVPGAQGLQSSLIPLYGRQSPTRRHRWHYYALLSNIKVPVTVGKRDCMDDMGCEELSDGDTVLVDSRIPAQARMYRSWDFQYNPNLV